MVKRDINAFRERFSRWKNGELVYDKGRPINYQGGKDAVTVLLNRGLVERGFVKNFVPFVEDKATKLTNAGLATGAVLSTNLLDSIADAAIRQQLPVKTAIGLAIKESTLGNPTDDTSVYKILNSKAAAMFKRLGTGQHINDYHDGQFMRGVVNYHRMDNYPESFNDFDRAFKFYHDSPRKYNPGLKNHPQLVEKRGEEAWKSPEILLWWRDRASKQLSEISSGEVFKHYAKPRYAGGKDEEEKNTWLDELVVTPNGATRGLKQSYPDMIPIDRSLQQEHEFMRGFNKRRSSASNAILQPIKTIAEYAPLSGDIFDIANVVHDTYDKNYASAASYLALAFLPNMIQKPLNAAFKFGLNTIGKKYGRGAANLINDIVTKPRSVVAARLRGLYPLTYAERKKYIERMNNMYSDLINKSDLYELEQQRKRSKWSDDVHPSTWVIRFRRPSIRTTNKPTMDQFSVAEYTYRPSQNGLITLPYRAKNSNLPSMTDKERKYDFLHEYTHDLQYDDLFAPMLSAKTFDDKQQRFVPNKIRSDAYISAFGYNPFVSATRWNSEANREIKELKKLGEVYDRSDYEKFMTLWRSNPDEYVAELRSRILGGDTMDEVYKYMQNRFGTSALEVDDLVKLGFKNGKDSGIHIKPSHRGKFTALKKRTGHSASWFKAHGTPAQKKMATFALNARKWKH